GCTNGKSKLIRPPPPKPGRQFPSSPPCRPIIPDPLRRFFRPKIPAPPFPQVRLLKNATGRRLFADELLDFGPFIEKEAQIAHEISGALALAHRSNDHADAFGNVELAQNFAETIAFFRLFDFPRNAAAIAEWHQDQIAPGETEIGGDARSLCSNRALGDLHDDFRADRIDARNVFGGDPFARPFVGRPIDFFDATVERGGNGIPEMEEGVFFEADVHEHRLQPNLDVLDFALVNAADDVARAFPLDAVFFKLAVLEQGDPALEFSHAEDEVVAGLA